ncbi:dCTP deaminase [Candidatus Caldarchaeum subterraneum]|uniref:dCTP deaminase n=1 Tax=Caldiarchaeum subterraneum TaxID=311458 RepID=E6N930_CALS0|nr:dCTP deaminase [Candidatus Caldarchaeum subterraneum]BAJ49737.1 dCTP deaminase [Candidatus Caldarchaeum subterraneum]BAJ51455.1 dCTP deaminase [Candidatus Caldarchaeum subterraneum]
MILSDFDLWNYIRNGRLRIEPFSEDVVRENGLDLRIGRQIARFNKNSKVFDTKKSDAANFYTIEEAEEFVINPHEHVLLHTLEYLALPKDLMGFVNLRSSYARIGLTIPPTIIDANFEGELTIELVGGDFPVKLYSGDRFLHVVFARLSSIVEKPYTGKYQGQRGVRLPSFR